MREILEEIEQLRFGLEALPPQAALEAQPNEFRKVGSLLWILSFGEKRAELQKNLLGLTYIAELLRQPEKQISCTALVSVGATGIVPTTSSDMEGMPAAQLEAEGLRKGTGDAGEALDLKAIQSYRRQLHEIAEQRRKVEGDVAVQNKLDRDVEMIEAELSRALGKGGKVRRTGDQIERDRQSVLAAIERAENEIEKVHPELTNHLRRSIQTGNECVYLPDPPVSWSL